MKRFTCALICFALVSYCANVVAQNLLVNGDFESSPAFSYYDGVGATDPNLVPGWTMFGHTPPDASSWVQVAFDAGAGTTDLDLSGSETDGTDPDFLGLSGIMTAAGSRPAVVAGGLYVASVTYDNYFASAGISYFIDWFDGAGTLISSDGGPLGDPNGPLGYDPYNQKFEIGGTAPGTAASAGVRFQSSNGGFAGAAADNFTLTQIPEPGSLVLGLLGGLGLLARGNKD